MILIFSSIYKLNLEVKVLNGFERLSEALKSLLWEKAKVHGISPIQIQLLVFISNHKIEICNVSYMAKEFNVTKATISDAVRVLIKKEYLEKVQTIDDLITAFYACLGGEPGEKRDWEFMKFLFHPQGMKIGYEFDINKNFSAF